jgi:circadian clock protein KaiC
VSELRGISPEHGAWGGRGPPRQVGKELPKAATGIEGLDEILAGGLPLGRPTLVCGGAGSGKTLLAVSFLVNGAERFNEPGVLMTFEENAQDVIDDVASLGLDLQGLIDRRKLVIDYVHVERVEIEEAGEYDLEGLFVRLDEAIKSVGAKRVVLDTIEALFSALSNEGILRAELRRLFRWLKDKGVTAIITGERGEGKLTRKGLEEYVSDAVISLDHRVEDQLTTRRLRVVKYRGSHHGSNEYPFLVDRNGIVVLPITSLGLSHPARTDRISSGVPMLDEMLGDRGYFRGSTVLVSGSAGTAKTSVAAHFIDAACRRGERGLYFLFEESPQQVTRNMRSIGLDLQPWVDQGLLTFHADRPSRFGLEHHLAALQRIVKQVNPSVVVMDPVTNLIAIGSPSAVRSMLVRVIDYLKVQGITGLFTSLTPGNVEPLTTEALISSLMDTWVLLTLREVDRARSREIAVLKSRGMSHSNRVREFALTASGFTPNDTRG